MQYDCVERSVILLKPLVIGIQASNSGEKSLKS